MTGDDLTAVLQACASHMQSLTHLTFCNVVAVEPGEDAWHVQVEMLEKQSIPRGMDILGLYDVWLDREGAVLRFTRRGTRRRADVSEPAAGG